MRTVADVHIGRALASGTFDGHAGVSQLPNFFQECDRVEYYAVTDYAFASRTQYAAGYKLKNELLAIDRDRVAGVVSAGIARDYREMVRKDINDLPLPSSPHCAPTTTAVLNWVNAILLTGFLAETHPDPAGRTLDWQGTDRKAVYVQSLHC